MKPKMSIREDYKINEANEQLIKELNEKIILGEF